LNGTHQPLPYADEMNLLGHNKGTLKKITESLIDVSKETNLEVRAENTKYVLAFRYKMQKSKFNLRTYKMRLKSGKACTHSVKTF
jgi:hypothetical protein